MSHRLLGLVAVILRSRFSCRMAGRLWRPHPVLTRRRRREVAGHRLGVGQQIWYAFQYAGDDSQILVDMQAKPGNGATFSIWTPADVANWAAGNKPDPVGHGSSDITSMAVTWSGRGTSTSPAPITSSSTRPVRP